MGFLTMTSLTAVAAGDRCEEAFQKANSRQTYPDRAAAVKYFESTRSSCGRDPQYLSRLSSFYLEVGRRQDAEATIDKGLSLHPLHRELLFGKGTSELSKGNFDAARAIGEKLVSGHGSWPGGFYLMQRVLMDQRRFSESIEFGNKAIELSGGGFPVFYLNAAVASYHTGNFDACVKYVETAIYKDPSVLSGAWGINEAIFALDRLDRRAEELSLAKRRKNADANWRADPTLM